MLYPDGNGFFIRVQRPLVLGDELSGRYPGESLAYTAGKVDDDQN